MSRRALTIFGAVCVLGAFRALPQASVDANPMPVSDEVYATDWGRDFTTYERRTVLRRMDGSLQEKRRIAYIQLETGENYLDSDGKWQPSQELIESFPDGAVAQHGNHKVIFAKNLNTAGAIDLQMPDGQEVVMSVLGLGYYDEALGKAALIASVKDCEGQIDAAQPNQIIYDDAFDGGFRAAVRYTYTKAGLEQDIILLERPPVPEEFGLSSRTSRMQVITEILSGPTPTQRALNLKSTDGQALPDEQLDFGPMQMGPGKAFKLGVDARTSGAPVGKQYLRLNGRNVLVEEVPVPDIGFELDELPLPAPSEQAPANNQGASLKPSVRTADSRVVLPARRLARSDQEPILTAQVDLPNQGVVLDYVTMSSASNFTFTNRMTYYVSGTVNLTGTTTIEGGAVIKYANSSSAKLSLSGPLDCLTAPYRPAAFTVKDDNSVGEVISGSSGSPSRYSAVTFLADTGGNANTYVHLRFSNAGTAISGTVFSNGFWNCQFVNCGTNVSVSGSGNQVKFHNVLLAQGGAAVSGSCTVAGEQVTADALGYFGTGGVTSGVLTNSVLTAVTSLGSITLYNSLQSSSSSGVYAGGAWGAYYLASGSTNRNSGTTNLDATLAEGLRSLTTYPPLVYSNVTITNTLTLDPQALRDTDVPDLGYHYYPLDYVFGGSVAESNLTFTAGTAVGWFRTSQGWSHAGYGIHLDDGVAADFNGTAEAPDYWVRCNTVQEGGDSLSYGPGGIDGWASALADSPIVNANFTRFSMLGNEYAYHIRDDYGCIIINLANCEVWSGGLGYYRAPQYYTNCLFDRCYVGLHTTVSDSSFSMRNCTVRGGLFTLVRTSSGVSVPVVVRENAFDDCSFNISGGNANATDINYNAYLTGTSANGTNNVFVSSFDWRTGPLGDFYQGFTNLVDQGSRNADDAGLYHYTTQVSQVKETNSVVDIGYHYVAVGPDSTGLVGYWPLDEGSGTNAYDFSGNSNDGALFNSPAWTSGEVNGALSFNGSSQYANAGTGSTLNLTGDMTIALWVKKSGTHFGLFIDKRGTGGNQYELWLRPDSLDQKLHFWNGTTTVNGSGNVSDDAWHHVALTRSGTTISFYIDGVFDVSRTLATPSSSTANLYINYAPGGYYADGTLDDIRIYSRALTGSEIGELASNTFTGRDTDGDGLPDYQEDADGDGTYDSGSETDWQTSENGTTGSTGLQVFTILN